VKAIVVRQPWATLIALGVKKIETRPSPPNGPMRPEGVRGLPGCSLERGERIAIVAGAAEPPAGMTSVGPWSLYGRRNHLRMCHLPSNDWHDLPLGAVVCTVAVDDAAIVDDAGVLAAAVWPVISRPEVDPDRWVFCGSLGRTRDITDEVPLGHYDDGRWGWLLSDPQPCDPIPCKGKQGVFTLPDEIAERLS
jgi:hypothetical protein